MAATLHNDAQIIASMLRELNVGDFVSWDDLSAAIGQEVAHGGPGAPRVASARRHLLHNDSLVFDATKNEDGERGLIRLDDSGKVTLIERNVRTMHRASGRILKRASTIDEKKLNQDERKRLYTATVQAGATRQFCGTKGTKTIAQNTGGNGNPSRISLAKTLQLFQSQKDDSEE